MMTTYSAKRSGRNHSLMGSPWQGAVTQYLYPIASPIRLLRLQENVRSNFLQRTWYPKQSWQTARVKAQSGDSLPKSPEGRNFFGDNIYNIYIYSFILYASTRNSGSNNHHLCSCKLPIKTHVIFTCVSFDCLQIYTQTLFPPVFGDRQVN